MGFDRYVEPVPKALRVEDWHRTGRSTRRPPFAEASQRLDHGSEDKPQVSAVELISRLLAGAAVGTVFGVSYSGLHALFVWCFAS